MSDTLREALEAILANPEHHETQGPHDGYISVTNLRAILATHPDNSDPEPPENVLAVKDCTDGEGDDSNHWGRTFDGEWKGYKDGGKEYLEWDELVRRWGPITWEVAK